MLEAGVDGEDDTEDAAAEGDGDDEDEDDDDSTPNKPRSARPGWLAASPSPASSTAGGGIDGFTGLAMWNSFT